MEEDRKTAKIGRYNNKRGNLGMSMSYRAAGKVNEDINWN